MKLIASVFLTTAVASGTASSPEEYLRRVLQMTDKSSACYNETEAILADDDFIYAVEQAGLWCQEAVTVTQTASNVATADIDFSVCDPDFTDSITEACTAANGE
jgi:hypothetical protein